MKPSVKVSALAWLLCLFVFFHLSSAHVLKPQSSNYLQARAKAAGAAGFGIELESRSINMREDSIPETDSSEADQKKLKGAVMRAEGYNKHAQWQLTAEQDTDTIRNIVPEFIVNGEVVGLGNGDVTNAINDILNYMDQWQPSESSSGKSVQVAGFDNHEWKIVKPSNYVADGVIWGIQVTASMPLEGIEDLFKEARDADKVLFLKNALLGKEQSNMHWVEDSHFAVDGNMGGKDSKYPANFRRAEATAEVRGFLSLVLTYAKGTSKYDPNNQSPKMISPIMPRTDFVGLYAQVKDKMVLCGSLFDLVNSLAQFQGDGSDRRDITRNLEREEFKFRGYSGVVGTVNVKAWIDGIEKGDDQLARADAEYNDNQIGKLERKLEGIYDSTRKAPIFEFRDIAGPTNGNSGLLAKIQGLEQAVITLHRAHRLAIRRGSLDLLDARATDNKKKECPRCKAGEATTGKNGACEKCPAGKKPSDDQSKCVDDKKCKAGEAQTGKDGACQKCPDGKVSSDDEKSCVDEKKCGAGEAKTGPDGSCQKCPSGQEPSADGKSCEDEKCKSGEAKIGGKCQKCPAGKVPSGDGKSCEDDKNDKDKDKKKARRKFCLGFFAGSGLIQGAEMMRTEEGIPILENAADDISTGKYENLDLELTDSNLDLDMDRSNRVPDKWLLSGNGKRDIAQRRGINALFTVGVILGRVLGQVSQNVLRVSRLGVDAVKVVGRTSLKVGGENKIATPKPVLTDNLAKLTKDQRIQKANDALKKITNHEKFDMCLSAAIPVAGMDLAQGWMHIENVPKGGFKAIDDPMAIFLFENEDDKKRNDVRETFGPSHYWMTYNDELWHHNRLIPETCQSAADMAGKVSAFAVTGGCCAFYADDDCKVPMWTATDRDDGNLKGAHNDATRSWSCTKDKSCKPLPNLNGYEHGQCGMHVVQYQGDSSRPIGFEVRVVDAKGLEVLVQDRRDTSGDILKFNVPKLDKELKFDITEATRGGKDSGNSADEHVLISIGQDTFWSNSTRCAFGAYDGWGGHPGARSGDCGFAC